MKLPLSDRLLACCGFVPRGATVADIGCDHGYLGIHLLTAGIASSVIAADVNEAPLQSAMRNAMKYGVRDKMAFFLSDGVRSIPRDFDTLVCAGMGADTMIHILQAAPWLMSDRYRLILQCQSKGPLLRRWLSDQGWQIRDEAIVRDGRFLYTVMSVQWAPDAPRLTPGQCYISPAMDTGSADFPEYCRRIVDGLRLAVAHQADPQKQLALTELENSRTMNTMDEVSQ